MKGFMMKQKTWHFEKNKYCLDCAKFGKPACHDGLRHFPPTPPTTAKTSRTWGKGADLLTTSDAS